MNVFLIVAATIVSFFLFAIFCGAFVIVKISFKPKKRTQEERQQEELVLKKVDAAYYDIPYNSIAIVGKMGNRLYAREYPNPDSNDYVVVVHGHNGASSSTVRFMKIFYDRGYNVLLADNRYSTKTGGKAITFGHYERVDTSSWIDYIFEKNSAAKVGIMGESMGAAVAMLVAEERRDLQFCIEYCGYASAYLAIRETILRKFKPAVICLPMALFFAQVAYGCDIKALSPMDSVAKITCPLLVMHSKADGRVPYYNHDLILSKAPSAQEVTFEHAPHGLALTIYPTEFIGGINKFLDDIGK